MNMRKGGEGRMAPIDLPEDTGEKMELEDVQSALLSGVEPGSEQKESKEEKRGTLEELREEVRKYNSEIERIDVLKKRMEEDAKRQIDLMLANQSYGDKLTRVEILKNEITRELLKKIDLVLAHDMRNIGIAVKSGNKKEIDRAFDQFYRQFQDFQKDKMPAHIFARLDELMQKWAKGEIQLAGQVEQENGEKKWGPIPLDEIGLRDKERVTNVLEKIYQKNCIQFFDMKTGECECLTCVDDKNTIVHTLKEWSDTDPKLLKKYGMEEKRSLGRYRLKWKLD